MTQTTIATRDGTTTALLEETVGAFRQHLRGPLLSSEEEGFEEATRIWNGVIEKTPVLVVQPTGTADVVAAVNFARENDLLLSVKGGGHNIAGTALDDDGITIDMSRLRGVIVDPDERTAIAQAGCLLGDSRSISCVQPSRKTVDHRCVRRGKLRGRSDQRVPGSGETERPRRRPRCECSVRQIDVHATVRVVGRRNQTCERHDSGTLVMTDRGSEEVFIADAERHFA